MKFLKIEQSVWNTWKFEVVSTVSITGIGCKLNMSETFVNDLGFTKISDKKRGFPILGHPLVI